MYLENLVFDALDPRQLGRFWEAAVGGERLTDEPAGFETRLSVEGGPVLDLCFQGVPEPAVEPPRLQLHLSDRGALGEEVERLLGLGARRLDDAAGEAPGEVLVDPEANPFWVAHDAPYADTGPLAVIRLDSADPDRDAGFWAWLSGWSRGADDVGPTLRHPSGRGVVLELVAEATPKSEHKNRRHLDLRLEAGDDADEVAAAIAEHGGREVFPEWGELPWRLYTDPSGNDFCVLPVSSS